MIVSYLRYISLQIGQSWRRTDYAQIAVGSRCLKCRELLRTVPVPEIDYFLQVVICQFRVLWFRLWCCHYGSGGCTRYVLYYHLKQHCPICLISNLQEIGMSKECGVSYVDQ